MTASAVSDVRMSDRKSWSDTSLGAHGCVSDVRMSERRSWSDTGPVPAFRVSPVLGLLICCSVCPSQGIFVSSAQNHIA